MKKLLLFMGLLSLPLLQNVTAQTLTYDALPTAVELGSAANFNVSYTSTVPAKINVALFIFDVDGSGNLTPDWSTWKAGAGSDVLPAAATATAHPISLSVPGNLTESSALPAGKTYVWSLTLNDAGDNWLTGSQQATTIVATSGAVNSVTFTGTAATEVNAGSNATLNYNYTLVEDGIVKVALSKYSSQEVWINDVATFVIEPAAATGTTVMQATSNIMVPADVIASADLTNGEMYKWEVSLFSPGWSTYLGGVKSNVVVNTPLVGLNKIAAKTFSIYPNPASSILILSGTNVEQAQVFDVSGKILINQSSGNFIDVSALSSGVYVVKINDGSTHKFIKN
jgi:hypothetical protein